MENDSTVLILEGTGVLSLICYLLFGIFVTKQTNFYKARRWKAAIWTSFLSFILCVVVIFVSIGGTIAANSPFINIGKIAGVIFKTLKFLWMGLLNTLPCLALFLFIITFGVYNNLKWQLNSDDILEKIWKDPNKNKKPPIEWL